MAIASYLKRSATRGNYSYRRSVPVDCRPLWEALEHKVSLKTKSHPEALRRAAQENTRFDDKVARIRQLNDKGYTSTDNLLQEAKEILLKEGIHPRQIPTTKAEADKFFEKQDDWSSLYIDTIDTSNGYNTDGTIWTDYAENRKSPYYFAHEILQGRMDSSVIPTLDEATSNYLKVNAASAGRTPHNQRKHEQRVWRAVSTLNDGNTPIVEINRHRARQHIGTLRTLNPTWADNTLERAIGILSAVFASAITEYELTMTNPWLKLTPPKIREDDNTSEDRENKRRSFNPEELGRYRDALLNINDEAHLIGLLMILTGCRTMEAGGLILRDVILDADIPHIRIRYNSIRNLKTRNSVRDIPLVRAGHEALSTYLDGCSFGSDEAPLFPKYGRDGGMDPLSSILNRTIRNRLKILDPNLVAYSTRHTMKDKLRKLRTPADIQHRILGHGTKSEADGYGDGQPLDHLLEMLEAAEGLTAWGT